MNERASVLIVDDQMGDLLWLLDLIQNRGYDVVVATNEEAAQERLRAIKAGTEAYALAVVDVMVAVKDLTRIATLGDHQDLTLDDKFFEDSRSTGIRLCQLARLELGIPAGQLLIACLTAREDDEVRNAMRELDIPLFHRAEYSSSSDSIRSFIENNLPAVST
jgi:CheY-like chemotaxis protein